jgi:hypothetical protein
MISRWLHTAAIALLLSIATASSAQVIPQDGWLQDIGTPDNWKIAVLSPLNHTESREAYAQTVKLLDSFLVMHQLNIVTAEELRPTLRRYRIRSTGQISVEDADIIRQNGGITTILIPSIDFYSPSSYNPEFGLSLRVVRPDRMQVIGAVSVSSTGMDHVRLFGVGKIEEIDSLISWVINKAVNDLLEQLDRMSHEEILYSKTKRIAVIQFNNLSDTRKAGSIVANWTIANLIKRGLVVIEPGAVAEIASILGDLPVGGIDQLRLKSIAWMYELDYIITGQVDKLQLARGNSKTATPSLEFSARLLEAETARIASTFHCEATGADGHVVFGLGKVRSAGSLLSKKLDKMLDEFKGTELRLTGTFDSK